MYHRVVPEYGGYRPSWNVTPEDFRRQLQGLMDAGYVPWSLERLVDAWQTNGSVPNHVFVVTFDDGYANNFLHAAPVLAELNVPATIFLTTGHVGSGVPFPFDDWPQKGSPDAHPELWRPLTLRECHELLASDVIDFGSHTHTHEDFRNRPDDFRDNLEQSRSMLQQEFGISNPLLSLPYGIISRGFAGPVFNDIAREAGFRCCLTTEEQLVDLHSSPFGWGRFIAEQHDTAGTLAVKLDGWRDVIRDQWRRIRGKSV